MKPTLTKLAACVCGVVLALGAADPTNSHDLKTVRDGDGMQNGRQAFVVGEGRK